MKKRSLLLTFLLSAALTACTQAVTMPEESTETAVTGDTKVDTAENEEVAEAVETDNVLFDPTNVPAYSGSAWVEINDNIPYFTEDDLTTTSFENYGDLDELERCTTAYANIGQDLMPTEERDSIGSVKPTGWQTVKYDNVDGKYLYNRCHLIGFQLTGENANKKNLITGTRYLNIEGMLPFENMVADYIKEANRHVLYRVTPVFTDDNLVADGVLMEGMSVEDAGEEILFCVYCYNVQPGITIDYATGESHLSTDADTIKTTVAEEKTAYILNTNTMKFHLASCENGQRISKANRKDVTTTREAVIADGYEPCGICKP